MSKKIILIAGPTASGKSKLAVEIAKKIKLARQLERFKCPQGEGGCQACKPLEKIVAGEAEKIGVSEYNQDVYIILDSADDSRKQSSIL